MKVGVTGTREGMTDAQRASFGATVIFDVKPTEFRHGSCKGVDVEAARIVRHVTTACRIVCHPGPDGDPCQEESGVDDERRGPKNHFARNRDIVDEADVLIVCPKDMEPQERGGTWFTRGYALKRGKRTIIVWPDGAVVDSQAKENP